MKGNPHIIFTNVILYISTLTILSFAFVCYYLLDIKKVIPQIFILYAIANVVNGVLFKIHKKVKLTYLLTAILIFVSTFLVVLFSGGVLSPFIFILPVVVLSGFVMNRLYGWFWLTIVLLSIITLYIISVSGIEINSSVPENSTLEFSLISIVLATFILGGIYGDYMAKSTSTLYYAKKEIEKKDSEKEIMLKEIHHRVKNNMQLITSLLGLQHANIENDEVKNLLMQSQYRIQAMAMIHEMLYHTDDLTKIPYDKYVKELTSSLISLLKGKDQYIDLKVDVSEMYLNLDTAIPLGLLINEIVTNSLKYAFTTTKKGCIYINLKKVGEKSLLLEIGDDGVGFDKEINSKTSKSLGLKLIDILSRQLEGNIEKLPIQGANYRLEFNEVEG